MTGSPARHDLFLYELRQPASRGANMAAYGRGDPKMLNDADRERNAVQNGVAALASHNCEQFRTCKKPPYFTFVDLSAATGAGRWRLIRLIKSSHPCVDMKIALLHGVFVRVQVEELPFL